MSVNRLYCDKSIIVCVKDPGIVSEDSGMPELLRKELGGEIYPVHRLDRDVGGVMVYARTKDAAAALCDEIAKGGMQKEYLAVVQGIPSEPTGELNDLLFHDRAKNKTYVVDRKRSGVKEASLDYSVVQTCGEMSLLSVRLHTGRSHQIRAQFASRKLPLVGDRRYGSTAECGHIALFAHRLSFTHPASKKRLSFCVMPGDGEPWRNFSMLRGYVDV